MLIYIWKEKCRIHYFSYQEWQIKPDKFLFHVQKSQKWPETGRLEEILNIKNKTNLHDIQLALCLNYYLLLQLSASQQLISTVIYTNIYFFPNSSSEEFDLHYWCAKKKRKEKERKCQVSSVIRVWLCFWKQNQCGPEQQ